jgi:hypothetical protein
MGPTLVPLLDVPSVPFHPSDPVPPPAVQEVAPLVDQASTMDWPVSSVPGVTVNEVMLAAGAAAVTLTLAEAGVLAPPGPLQVRV